MVDRPDPNNNNASPVTLFDDDAAIILTGDDVAPVFANGVNLDERIMRSLFILINRTGIIPRILRDNLDNIPTERIDPHASVPQATLEGLQRRPVAEADVNAEGTVACNICHDDKKVGDEVTVLPCHHFFDKACIEAWLRQHRTCPVCRRSVDGGGEADLADDRFVALTLGRDAFRLPHSEMLRHAYLDN